MYFQSPPYLCFRCVRTLPEITEIVTIAGMWLNIGISAKYAEPHTSHFAALCAVMREVPGRTFQMLFATLTAIQGDGMQHRPFGRRWTLFPTAIAKGIRFDCWLITYSAKHLSHLLTPTGIHNRSRLAHGLTLLYRTPGRFRGFTPMQRLESNANSQGDSRTDDSDYGECNQGHDGC